MRINQSISTYIHSVFVAERFVAQLELITRYKIHGLYQYDQQKDADFIHGVRPNLGQAAKLNKNTTD